MKQLVALSQQFSRSRFVRAAVAADLQSELTQGVSVVRV